MRYIHIVWRTSYEKASAKNKASHTKITGEKESPKDNTDQIKKIEKTIAGIKSRSFFIRRPPNNVDITH